MDIPQKCISFSPNWYYPQILQMNDSHLAYGANEQVFVYNWKQKSFQYYLQAPNKVSMLYYHNQMLFVGSEGGVITMFEGQKYLGKLELNVETPLFLQYNNGQYELFDQRGVGIAFQLKDYQLCSFKLVLITQPHHLPKLVKEVVIYGSGRIYDLIQQKHMDYGYKVLCADFNGQQYAVLYKNEKTIGLHVFRKQSIWKWDSNTANSNQTLDQDEHLIELKFVVNQKLDSSDLKKQPLSIKFIDNDRIIVTTKQGEIFIISLNEKQKTIKLDASMIDSNKLPIEVHTKGIFLMGLHEDIIYTVGVDRRIALLRVNQEITLEWRLILLSCKATNFRRGFEQNLLFFQDKSLKALDLTKKHDPFYVNDFYQIHDFNSFDVSPFSEGIVAIQREQKIEIIDVYRNISYGKLTCEDPICKMIFLNKEMFELWAQVLSQQQMIIDNRLIIKPLPVEEYLYILMLSGRYMIVNLKTGEIVQESLLQNVLGLKDKIIDEELITIKMNTLNLQFMDNKCYIIFVYNGNKLFYLDGQKNYHYQLLHSQHINSIDCQINNKQLIVISGSNNQTIGISVIQGKIMLLGYLKHKFPIEKVMLRQCIVLAIAKNHSSLQLYDISSLINCNPKPSKETHSLELGNVRGHSGYLLEAELIGREIITSAEDQTIKCFGMEGLKNTQPPNKHKHKKIK